LTPRHAEESRRRAASPVVRLLSFFSRVIRPLALASLLVASVALAYQIYIWLPDVVDRLPAWLAMILVSLLALSLMSATGLAESHPWHQPMALVVSVAGLTIVWSYAFRDYAPEPVTVAPTSNWYVYDWQSRTSVPVTRESFERWSGSKFRWPQDPEDGFEQTVRERPHDISYEAPALNLLEFLMTRPTPLDHPTVKTLRELQFETTADAVRFYIVQLPLRFLQHFTAALCLSIGIVFNFISMSHDSSALVLCLDLLATLAVASIVVLSAIWPDRYSAEAQLLSIAAVLWLLLAICLFLPAVRHPHIYRATMVLLVAATAYVLPLGGYLYYLETRQPPRPYSERIYVIPFPSHSAPQGN
jgi:hypothetical protein